LDVEHGVVEALEGDGGFGVMAAGSPPATAGALEEQIIVGHGAIPPYARRSSCPRKSASGPGSSGWDALASSSRSVDKLAQAVENPAPRVFVFADFEPSQEELRPRMPFEKPLGVGHGKTIARDLRTVRGLPDVAASTASSPSGVFRK